MEDQDQVHHRHQDEQKELQLLPAPTKPNSSPPPPQSLTIGESQPLISRHPIIRYNHRSSSRLGLVDLQLSISLRPARPGREEETVDVEDDEVDDDDVERLKWEAAEQIRMAAMEKAYAERVRELTRREMEMAQSEFARARHVWERAREEVDRAERLKDRATNSACMEITCHSCRQRFTP